MTESWTQAHVRENPGHIVTESIFLPPWCETCEAKSPGWDIEDGYFTRPAPTPTFEETLRLVEELAKVYPAPPLPSRIDVSTSVLEVLRSKAEAAGAVTTGTNPLFGIPVVEDPTLAPGEWKIVPRDEHKHP